MSRDQEGVVQLPAAGVPADQGVSSLGLIMQLAGTLMALAVAMLAFIRLVSLTDRGDAMWMFLLLGSCVVRSVFHRIAGTELLYGRSGSLDAPGTPLAGLYRYIVIGLAHSIALPIALVALFHAPGLVAVGVGLGLAVWPATLGALVAAKVMSRFATKIPVSEDKGFEGASILMTVLGVCGVLGGAAVLMSMVELGALHDGKIVLILIAVIMLIVRSLLHVQAGVSGLRTTSIDRSVELANRYASFGVISSFCAGGAMLLVVMMGRLDVSLLAAVTSMTWMLMTWPMIIRRFFGERQFADLLAGDEADVHRRAPDAGLTGLGWLLLAHAAYGATCLLPGLIGAHGSSEVSQLFDVLGSAAGRSPWWSVGVIVLEVWAGYELIRMTAHHRVIAMLYSAIAVAVTLYLFWPIIGALDHVSSKQQMLVMLPVAIALVVPVSTLVLVNRKIAPAARARFRAKA